MKKKGFTLIELLAVILILGIIALIAIPQVTKIIEESKRGAFKTTVENLLRAAEQNCQVESLNGKEITKKYKFTNGKVDKILNIKGDLPKDGAIIVDDSCNVSISVSDGTYLARKEYASDKINMDKVNLCVRAASLHEEECTQTDEEYYCSGAGYTKTGSKGTTTIKYGNEKTEKGKLNSGDPFDCDVNGDGYYDSKTERFYYITDYYNTSTKEFETDKATLLYYSNVSRNQEDELVVDNTTNGLTPYSSQTQLQTGPIDAITKLPKSDDWSNVYLINEKRAILADDDSNVVLGVELPTNFSYEGYAARFLTYQEIRNVISYNSSPRLDRFTYFLENTKFASEDGNDYWIETYRYKLPNRAFKVEGNLRIFGNIQQYNERSVRPVIELYKTQINY